MPADFLAFEATSYTIGALTAVGLTARLQFGPEYEPTCEERHSVHFTTVNNCSAVWSNRVFVEQIPDDETNVTHKVYLGDGIMIQPPGQQLEPEQHQQVIKAFAQNPTIASHVKTAITPSGVMGKSVNIQLPGYEYAMAVSKDDWPASGQTSSMTTVKGMPSTFRTHTPTQQTSSLLAVIPSTSTVGTQHVGPPPGFPAFHEDPIELQAAIREQITADAKTLSTASRVLCTDFCHMGNYYSKEWKVYLLFVLRRLHTQ